ncbi:MAG: MurR/RpiR family transcriptional regulator [Hyphomicrobiaceae bacterium]
MHDGPLHQEFSALVNDLPAQQQAATRWILRHPQEVALYSMRHQAREAGVTPVTMTRLAQRLGFKGYDDIRALYVKNLRKMSEGFSERADIMLRRHRSRGKQALAVDLFEAMATQVLDQRRVDVGAALADAVDVLLGAERILSLGQRSSYAVAFQFWYVCSLAGFNVQMVDGPAAAGGDVLHGVGKSDALFVVSVSPYTRATLEMARIAAARGVRIVALTDSDASPLSRLADVAIPVGTESPSYFHTMTPAFAVAEAVAALLVAGAGKTALDAIARNESALDQRQTYIRSRIAQDASR